MTSKTTSAPAVPVVKITAKGASRLKSGHVWVYRSDIESTDSLPPGSMVEVHDHRGRKLGIALYSTSSQIALRMLSASIGPSDLPALVRERIQAAIEYRSRVVHDTDACRVVFSEADLLPGLIVDRYNDLVSFQVLTQAMDPMREVIVDAVAAAFSPAGIVERVDPRIRELERLAPGDTRLLRGDKAQTVVTLNGVKFHYDALGGQKTGAFLDQRENYSAAAQYARGQALDVFCYQGGFALHLARTCESVTGVDSSRPALEQADRNAALNGREIEWIEANAFDLLRDYSDSGRQYDTIVLDPPAFAKSKRNLETAMRGYKELNLRALKMMRPGGVLVTCSCSYHVSDQEFVDAVTSAAVDVRRAVRVLEKRGAAKDHPILLGVPETAYLKCLILSVQ